MERKIEVAINRIIGDLQSRGLCMKEISNVAISTAILEEGMLLMVYVFSQRGEPIEYEILVTPEDEEEKVDA